MSGYTREILEGVKSEHWTYELENAIIRAPFIEADFIRLKNCKIEGTNLYCHYVKLDNVSGHIPNIYAKTSTAFVNSSATCREIWTPKLDLEQSNIWITLRAETDTLTMIDSKLVGAVIARDARLHSSILMRDLLRKMQYPLEIGYSQDGGLLVVTAHPWQDRVIIDFVAMSIQEAFEHFKDRPEDLKLLKQLHRKAVLRGKAYEQFLNNRVTYRPAEDQVAV